MVMLVIADLAVTPVPRALKNAVAWSLFNVSVETSTSVIASLLKK